jgi:hypothetical protein
MNFLNGFSKNTQISKFHENPSSGSRVLPHGQTDGHTDMTKLTVAFCKLVNVLKKGEGLQPRPEETYSASMFLNLLWQSSYWLKPPLLSTSYSFDYPCSSHPACVIKPHLQTSHLYENKPNFINPEDGGSTFLLMFMPAYMA